MNNGILLVDVRSFVKYSQFHIRTSINIAAPNTILKRPSFTLDKVSGVIISERDRRSWENSIQNDKAHIIFYDQQSDNITDSSAIYYLCLKLREIGHQGVLGFLKGGMSAFFKDHPNHCTSGKESSNAMTSSLSSPSVPPTPGLSGLPPVVLGSCLSNRRLKKRPIEGLHLGSLPQPIMTPSTVSFTNDAFNPFFSNIRQNMELCHGSIKERFPVRFPKLVEYDPNTGLVQFSNTDQKMRDCSDLPNVIPPWMRKAIDPELGPKNIAESYEIIERLEQKRLQQVMAHHSKISNNFIEHPFSIVAGIEKGTLNRYTNVWPFEYTRVKLNQNGSQLNDYINASFIQYVDCDTAHISTPSALTNEVPKVLSLDEQDKTCASDRRYRRYISTQGPLPTTFNDFWEVVWEQNTRVIVMLTKEEEMNRIKCHRYWPSEINKVEAFGPTHLTLLSEIEFPSKAVTTDGSIPDLEEGYIVRRFQLEQNGEIRMVHHFQYKGWQDFGVPNDPLGTLELVSLVDQEQIKYENMLDNVGPMIVHCSAGCGRTGAFCTIDTIISRMKGRHYLNNEERSGEIDLIFQTVSKFREQRVSMVQTLRQYVFCYEAILWWMLGYE
ncbi:hypothetical protein INT47_007660 [Mucor saturninus]|uniref:protein-tyrosine-phosphatase n=1 Tax=Mucor saturninus TaxID=64648 RepID=A0A8H7QP60_9FUNG|nr:hypothetical protein INT47_007660 [Mucor saturninus]